MKIFKKLFFLLTPRERYKAGLIVILIFIMSLLDAAGVASILPFMAVLANPSIIETNIIINTAYQFSFLFGVKNDQQFLFFLGSVVFVFLVVSLFFKALTNYAQIRFVQMREYTIGKRLIESYLHQPYSWFLSKHSADIGKMILSEVQAVISRGIKPVMECIAKGMTTISLLALLVIINPNLALTIGLSLSIVYLTIFYFFRSFLNRIGTVRLKNNQVRFKVLNEAFGAVKEVKIMGLENTLINNFSVSSKLFAKTQAVAEIVAELPRFILEAIAFGGMLLIVLYVMLDTKSLGIALPIVTLYAFAGYRILPALQQIFRSITALTFIKPSVDRLYFDLKNLTTLNKKKKRGILKLNKEIVLENISFNYPSSKKKILKKLNLNIKAKSIIGFVGTTGSGKTTLVDIILGLLKPQTGTLMVDKKIITSKNLKLWQNSIGYVPQQIFLSDNTIEANIAFGQNVERVNYHLIKKVSKIANIDNFISQELPLKYKTIIGERGVKLSGGQRQRIGIARALYHKPKILILDEATSSLDNYTEKKVMDALINSYKNITIIIIAHRLETLKKCDQIYQVKKGELFKLGKYRQFIKNNIR